MSSVQRFAPWVLALLLCCLAGCKRGPEPALLEQELQARLDTSFQQDLFRVAGFRRTGSAPFNDLVTEVSGVYVYYDAELEFVEDYSLTQWRGLNLGTLAFAVGATEDGVTGFHSRGNTRGDRLYVHGRLAFTRSEGKQWVALRNAVDQSPVKLAEGGRDGSVRGVDAILRDTRLLLAKERAEPVAAAQIIVLDELESALRRIDLAQARIDGKLTLGSGPPKGTYFEFGETLRQVAEQQGVSLFSAESAGSVENASRLQAAALDFGLVQSDVLQLMYQGLQEEYYFPSGNLRAVASLWPEAVHLVTLERTGIREMGDLLGKRIAIGQRGSGSRVNALLIGMAARLSADRMPVVNEIGLDAAIAQLETGDIDALFLTAAVPAAAIQALAARRDDVRFVPVRTSLVGTLDDSHYAYYPLTVAERTYPGQKEPFTTLGLTAALVTHVDVADERVEKVLELLLSSGEELARRYYRAAFISRETMRLGLAVPLHPAAERFYSRYDKSVPPTSSTGQGAQGSNQGGAAGGSGRPALF